MGLPWFLQNTNKGSKYYANKNKDKHNGNIRKVLVSGVFKESRNVALG